MTSDAGRGAQERGAAFILADMVLVVIMLAIVKQAGASFPPAQLVFLRALVGLVLIVPLAWRHREALRAARRMGGHVGRVLCSALALSCNFTAVVALPLALVTAIGFTRPFVVLALAVLVLGERVSRTRWIASGLCFAGVLFMTRPGEVVWDWALLAAFGSVLFGSIATIQTRRLAGESTAALMVFYTLGLALLTAPPAALVWVPPRLGDLPILLAIGGLAQVAQFCFLRAHQITEARVLAPLGYLMIVLSTLADYLIFGVVPTLSLLLGATLIVGTALVAHVWDGR